MSPIPRYSKTGSQRNSRTKSSQRQPIVNIKLKTLQVSASQLDADESLAAAVSSCLRSMSKQVKELQRNSARRQISSSFIAAACQPALLGSPALAELIDEVIEVATRRPYLMSLLAEQCTQVLWKDSPSSALPFLGAIVRSLTFSSVSTREAILFQEAAVFFHGNEGCEDILTSSALISEGL